MFPALGTPGPGSRISPDPHLVGADSHLGRIRSQGSSECTSVAHSGQPVLLLAGFYILLGAHVTVALLLGEVCNCQRGPTALLSLKCHQNIPGVVLDYRSQVNGLPTW